MQSATLIVNPISGGRNNKQPLVNRITRMLAERDIAYDTLYTSKRGEATDFARKSADSGKNLVVAIGGDGTINEVASGLVNTDVTMGIIPYGSGNGLARSLDLPMNARKAALGLFDGREYVMDVGRLNKRYFFLVAGVGFDAAVGKSFDEHPTRGPIPYFYLSTRQYLDYIPEQIKVAFNNKSLEISPFLFAVANGLQYGNNAFIAPEAKLNDGIFDITIIHRMDVQHLFSAVPKLFTQRLADFSEAEFHKTTEVCIERQSEGAINLDGEPVHEDAVLEITMLPKSLKIIAPDNVAGLLS